MTATIQVLVRDAHGNPIAGLGLDDFIVTELGARDAIVDVRSLSSPEEMQPASSVSEGPSRITSSEMRTWILLVLAPSSASGRNFAIAGLLKFLDRPMMSGWRLALLDDAGRFTGFSHDPNALRSRLQELSNHVSAQQFYGGSWMSDADRAIQELAIQPGRHAILFTSDFESNVSFPDARNPKLLRVGPSAFVGSAVAAQAEMYTVEASGPGVVVPFGGAAEAQYFGSGQQVAEMINQQTVGLAQKGSDFAYAAKETGGQTARDVQEALSDIASDGAGYYRITFRPDLQETDGGWHPVSVVVRGRNVRVRTPGYYLAPTGDRRHQIPAQMLAALKAGRDTSGLDAAAHVWLFPDAEGGAHIALMAADFTWPANKGDSPPGTRLQVFAQLVDQTIGQVVGSWFTEHDWKDVEGRFTLHWQRETPLYPGSYALRIVAMDAATGTIGTRVNEFASYPSGGAAFRLGATVVADHCLEPEEIQGRTNLLDPVLLDGCLLAPSAAGSFTTSQRPTIMVRIYATDQKLRRVILKKWKASAIIGDGLPLPLSITPGDVRGLVVAGKLELSKLGVKAGVNTIDVVFETGNDGAKKSTISLRSQLTIEP